MIHKIVKINFNQFFDCRRKVSVLYIFLNGYRLQSLIA